MMVAYCYLERLSLAPSAIPRAGCSHARNRRSCGRRSKVSEPGCEAPRDPFETAPPMRVASLVGRPFHLFPHQNGPDFATILRPFEGRRCRNRKSVPVEFEEPDLLASRPILVP